MTKLININEWRKRRFTEESAPSSSQVRRWCNSGVLPCKRIGGTWYILADAELLETGNELVDNVLFDRS